MKRILLIITLLVVAATVNAADSKVECLFERLDSMIANSDLYLQKKLDRLAGIKREGKNVRTDEERFWHNRRLYDEYLVFDADSAMRYVEENLTIARSLGNRNWESEWKINKSFIFSVTGLLKDAEEELVSIDVETLPEELMSKYYDQWTYLYSHVSQLAGHRSGRDDYDKLTQQYGDSTFMRVTPDNPQYLWLKGQSPIGRSDNRDALKAELKQAVDTAALDSRLDAMNAYLLARMYGEEGDRDNQLCYLIKSGMADVATVNRDIASLEELASIVLGDGDVDRAYLYINYCQHQALKLPNHVRAASLTKMEALVHQLYVDKLRTAGKRMELLLVILCIALVLLVILTAAVVNRHHKLSISKDELKDANSRLNSNLAELSAAKEQQEQILDELKNANEQIIEINSALKEANYVKEECIGATFSLCSSYIDRLEELRKSVSRLVRANSWNELRKEVSDPSFSGKELKDFYKSFDTLFLNIYPDFVKDFNNLLQEEERIAVKPGELNTELRIYAFVRLGITDSVKIASLLHCSPQTVYNYRLRTRNKAIIPKKTFAEAVKSLGKYQN